MLKRHNKKCKTSGISSFGKISCLTLLFLTFLLINPATTSVSALEAEEASDDDTSYDDQISTQANSGVTISFSPASGSASLTPATPDGASAKINVSANIKIASTGGYTIYLGSKNAALTGERTGETIAATSSAKTFANLDTNTWGYAAVEGLNVSDSTTYSALPQGQGIKLVENSGNATDVDHTFTLSFATKISNDKPADTYSNQATLSVVNSPKTVTFTDYTTTMQGMTSAICSAVDAGAESQLRDIRDGKYYWVSKLADGRCWMTQNLDLNLSTSKTLTPSDTDVSSNWTPEYTTATVVDESTILASDIGQRSWNLGQYRIANPTTGSSCGSGKNSAADCPEQFTAYNTPMTANGEETAHYILGNHYQWNAATAGTGGTITSGQASGSICPKGWKLPMSNSTDVGSFGGLIDAGGIGTDAIKLTSAPYYFVRGGAVFQNSDLLFNAGNEGDYWSSTPYFNSSAAYRMLFTEKTFIAPTHYNVRALGFSIRCIAR